MKDEEGALFFCVVWEEGPGYLLLEAGIDGLLVWCSRAVLVPCVCIHVAGSHEGYPVEKRN